MIHVEEIRLENAHMKRAFILDTDNTTYIFAVDRAGNLVHLYYGDSIQMDIDMLDALIPKQTNQNGCSIIADKVLHNQCLDDVCLEISGRGKGDMREPFVDIEYADGSRTCDFRYKDYRVEKKINPAGLPGAYDESGNTQSLVITLCDYNHENVKLELVYSVFERTDCITRFARVINESEQEITLHRLMSVQLDEEAFEWKVTSFHGDWTREMGRYDVLLQAGKYVNDSATGFSSNKANPFVMFGESQVSEYFGKCYACNLIYSGNHREYFEDGGHGKKRMLAGINPDFFRWKLESGESFDAPEAVLTYADNGYEGISAHMHAFVSEHIVRGTWKKKQRPVLLNSWEATYFDVQEKKVLKLAKAAKEVGIELFVLDDGWFGKRDNDACSLGDWYDNKKKLPDGLSGLAQKVRNMGMSFGIWVEPEMVSEDSDLYRNNPDWAVKIPGNEHSAGRNQMVLDMSKREVQDYIIDSMTDVFTRSKAEYVKWDMNRHMSDMYSQGFDSSRQQEFAHRYILGLYRVLDELTKRFPDILFEACASGGNRFDLGMLCYMPQVWASDCTDAICRGAIQNGYSYGYPQSVIGAHVSGCPNHQTLRVTPIETRFAVASAGILGYEYNLCDAKSDELDVIKEQITTYKKWRQVLQFGQLYRLNSGTKCAYGNMSVMNHSIPYDTDVVRWNIVSEDQAYAVGIVLQGQVNPNYSHHKFKTRGLAADKKYHFYNRKLKYDIHRMGDLVNTISPVHIKQDSLVHEVVAKFVKLDGEIEDITVSGAVLNKAGVQLAQSFPGTGFGANTAIYQDYDARMYFMEII